MKIRLRIEQLEPRLQMATQTMFGTPAWAPGASSGFSPPSMPVTATNTTQVVKVLVINFDPEIPSQGNKHLSDLLWMTADIGGPHVLADNYKQEMEKASGGAIKFDIVEWRDVNDTPVLSDGYHWNPDDLYQNYLNPTGLHDVWADFPTMAASQNFAGLINAGLVDEIWLFGGGFGEVAMAGPDPFFINGGVYTYPEAHRSFVLNGFTPTRAVDCMMHNTGHRLECTMDHMYGGWNVDNPSAPLSNWDRFAAVTAKSNGVAGVGFCHFPANGESDYDYGNPRSVLSTAEDFLNYPNLTGATTLVSRDTWSRREDAPTYYPDYHKDYLAWMFGHLPRASGTTPDGRQSNWWKYLYNFNNYEANTGLPKPFKANAYTTIVTAGTDYTFTVSLSSAYDVRKNSINSGDVVVSGPNGFTQPATLVGLSSPKNCNYMVATYKITAPGGTWDYMDNGSYNVSLNQNAVQDKNNRSADSGFIGTFSADCWAAVPPPAPTEVAGVPGNKSVTLFWKNPQVTSSNPYEIVYAEGKRITVFNPSANIPSELMPSNYVVEISTDNKTWTTVNREPSTATQAAIGGLRNNVRYFFRVHSVNRYGDSKLSDIAGPVIPKGNLVSLNYFIQGAYYPGISLSGSGGFKKGDTITFQYLSGRLNKISPAPVSPDNQVGGMFLLGGRKGSQWTIKVPLPAGTQTKPFTYTFTQDVKNVYFGMNDGIVPLRDGFATYRITTKGFGLISRPISGGPIIHPVF